MDNSFKKNYIEWLNKSIEEYQISQNIYRITLPYLDRNNDCTEIYIRVDGNKYTLTDDGETIGELELSNFNLFSSQKRVEIFNSILSSHGVMKSEDNELYVISSKEELPQKKHLLSQCMIKVSDLFYTAKNTVQSLFLEDVQIYLDQKDIRYTPNVSFYGKSGLMTTYDFAIPKSKNAPERIIKVINNIDQTQTNNILFLWDDTRQNRDANALLYVFIHDAGKKISASNITAMENYNVVPVKWSKRENYVSELIK